MRDPALYARVLRFTANFLVRPIVEFARRYGGTGAAVTNLVVLSRLLPADGREPSWGMGLLALALSPALLRAFADSDDSDGLLWREIDVPPDFAPMVFVGDEDLARVAGLEPVLRDLIVAHELGHTGGLMHRPRSGNLMVSPLTSGAADCTSSLDPDQMAILGANLGLAGPGTARGMARSLAVDAARTPLHHRFPPELLRLVLGGDREALRVLLAPLAHRYH
jgi:hypothetical protein